MAIYHPGEKGKYLFFLGFLMNFKISQLMKIVMLTRILGYNILNNEFQSFSLELKEGCQ